MHKEYFLFNLIINILKKY